MSSFSILTTYSPWLLIACLAAGAFYAWLLYSKRTPWSRSMNYGLAFVRFVVVSFLAFLLLGPLVRYISSTTVKPTIVFAIDNSSSISLFSDTVKLRQTQQQLQQLAEKLQDEGYNTSVRTLSPGQQPQDISSIRFNQEATNLSQLLSNPRNEQEQQNLAGVVLLSDGIVNQGTSPAYANYNFTIYPVAMGDTVPKKDLILSSLRYNKVNYSGNRFPIEAELQHEGFSGTIASVALKENGKVLERRQVTLRADRGVQLVPFSIMAAGLGKRHYEVEVLPVRGEFTTLNNTKHAYIDVVKGKIKILVAAAAPHPDIKALRAAIESNENYETELFIPGLTTFKQQDYDVAVLHQLPGTVAGGEEALNLVRQKQVPALYIIGPQSNISAYNRLNVGLNIGASGGNTDEVTSAVNTGFSTFKLPEEAGQRMLQYPPAVVPYGELGLSPNTETVLYQQVGRVRTNRPLLTVQTTGNQRNATMLASGTWQWRLSEAAAHEQPAVFDKLITNLIQLLSAPRNKKRLNVYPVREEYSSADEVYFEAETYNQALEPVYGQNINLKVTAEDGTNRNFTFTNGESQAGVNIGSLPGGRYTYQASTRLSEQLHQDKGEFVVEELQLESLHAVADHNLLYQLGSNTGSRLYTPEQLEQLQQDILANKHKDLIVSNEALKDIVDLKWLFFVLLTLISAEWFIRKFNGSY